ncbi:MAG: transposase, partial [Pirellulaceae bacterium]
MATPSFARRWVRGLREVVPRQPPLVTANRFALTRQPSTNIPLHQTRRSARGSQRRDQRLRRRDQTSRAVAGRLRDLRLASWCFGQNSNSVDAELRERGLYDLVPKEAWTKDFVVDIEPVEDGRSVVAYLAPYVYRVAISDHRIKEVTAAT